MDANRAFLDWIIQNQVPVVFASGITEAEQGSGFLFEIEYLLAHGCELGLTGMEAVCK